ncbi:hypothetical protein PFLUV_G00091780 [Perca fluviatilis]|uniref:Uncharacterized protein n=1 Tax=Perca fluviatilis TaxID=8168 RepID=A0A6A5EH43_PERFL|nr:hypothetical protein PFLUV_G00091780 [Perca fluviatilis]
MPSNPRHGLVQLTILLLLPGDVERNPGPQPSVKTQTGVLQNTLFATLLNNLLVANAGPRLPLPYTPLALPGQPPFTTRPMACFYSPPVLPWLSVPVARMGAFVGGGLAEFAWMVPLVAFGPGLQTVVESSGVAMAAGSERLQRSAVSSPTDFSVSVKEVISLQEWNTNISSGASRNIPDCHDTLCCLDFIFLHLWTFVPETFSTNSSVSLLLLTLELISLLSFRST